jgi:excisionase family DNA binding protein
MDNRRTQTKTRGGKGRYRTEDSPIRTEHQAALGLIDAARYLGCSDTTVRRLRRRGVLVFFLVGDRPFISRATLDAFVAQRQAEAEAQLAA